jgi:hypothetical protein
MNCVLPCNKQFYPDSKYFNIFKVYSMVYMSGSKSARHQSSLVGRTNVCGGIKKAGTGYTVGLARTTQKHILARTVRSVPKVCTISNVIQTQRYGYKATL